MSTASAVSIPFSQIPATNLFVPGYYVEFSSANDGVAGNQIQNSLLICQTVNALPGTVMYVPSAAWAANQAGAGSQLALMAAEYYNADPAGTLYAFPLADAEGSAAAVGNFSFVGPATAAGTLWLMVAGRTVQVGVTAAMAAVDIAAAVAAAINAFRDINNMALPVTAAVDGTHSYQVDVTAVNKGAVGNNITLGLNFQGSAAQQTTPAGLTVTITAMAGGATDPDLASVGAAMGKTAYDFIMLGGYAESTQLNEMMSILSFQGGRWGYQQKLFGHVWTAFQSADGNAGSDLLTFGATRNDAHMSVVGYESGVPNAPFEVAAGFAGAFAQASKASPTRPSQTLVIPNLLAAPASAQFGFNTENTLLATGIALMQPVAGGGLAIMRSVTTYQQNGWGQTDRGYLDAETMFQLTYYVRQQQAALLSTFPRAILAAEGTNLGQQGNLGQDTAAVVAPSTIKSFLVALYAEMCPGGSLLPVVQDQASYAAGLVVQANAASPGRADILDDPILLSGWRMSAVLNAFRLVDPANANGAAAA